MGILTVLSTLFIKTFSAVAGSAKANGREPKTGLGRVFNYKLGCYDDVRVLMYAYAHPYLKLKTRPRFCPLS